MARMTFHPLANHQLITTGGELVAAVGALAGRSIPFGVLLVETEPAMGTTRIVYATARGFNWQAIRVSPVFGEGLGSENRETIAKAVANAYRKPVLLVLTDCGKAGEDLAELLDVASRHAHPRGICGIVAITHDKAQDMIDGVRAAGDTTPIETHSRHYVPISEEDFARALEK